MKKGQVSFEYSILFAFVFLLFLVLASAFYYGVKKTDSSEYIADNLAKEIKIKIITASLSESDYESEVKIPEFIDGKEIKLEVHTSPDNILYIKQKDSGLTLSRAFLPIIDTQVLPDENNFNLVIKKSNNKIDISSS